MWTTASLSAKEHMFLAPPKAPDVGNDYNWEQFFVHVGD